MIPLSYLLEQKQEPQIYCDLDGVLTYFNGSAKKLGYNGPFPARKSEDKKRLWDLVRNDPEKFWGDMPWLPDGKKLWNYIKNLNPIILSSVGNSMTSKLGSEGKKGKLRWIKRELGPEFMKTAIIVPSGGKEKYASPMSILIDDDDLKNVTPWMKNRGIGIYHKSADQTIKQLDSLMKTDLGD